MFDGIPKDMIPKFGTDGSISAEGMTKEQQEFWQGQMMNISSTDDAELAQTMTLTDVQLQAAGLAPGFAYPAFCRPGSAPANRFFCGSVCPYGFMKRGLFCKSICPWGYRQHSLTCNRPFFVMKANTLDCPWYDKCGILGGRGCSLCPPGTRNIGCLCVNRMDIHLRSIMARRFSGYNCAPGDKMIRIETGMRPYCYSCRLDPFNWRCRR
jgi:hypothetical protein